MAAERLPMRKLREVVRLKLDQKLSGRAIARSCSVSPSTVSDYVGRITLAKLTWPLPPELDDDARLEALLFPAEKAPQPSRPEPDWAWIHGELKKPNVTKLLLWQEYREEQPEGYGYSQFCEKYQRWARPLNATMRQVHRAGEKCFIDFSGDGIDVVDPATGECKKAVLFVAVLGASNLTYVEPVLHQDLPTWIGCHVRAFEYFGGVSQVWVPDNPKVGVTRADKYEPELNPTYADLARHYEAVVVPARPRRPRDKAKVEAGVLIAERWILAVLRNRSFYSLSELRTAVAELVERAEHAADAQAEEVAPPALRRDGAGGAETVACARIRARPLGTSEGLPRLPRRIRQELLQRLLSTPGGAARASGDGDHDRDLPARSADHQP